MVAFGTSGLRGLATELVAGVGYDYVSAFARYMLATKRISAGTPVLVGCDRRESSPQLTRHTIAALREAGLDPIYCGVLPTPALAYEALNIGASAVMVTGSHIPADRNGLKFYRPDGEIDKQDELAISDHVRQLTAQGTAFVEGEALPEPDRSASDRFVSRYKAAFPASMLAGKRVGVYQHSSVARDILVELAQYFGAEVVRLGEVGVFVAIDTEAVDPETAAQLAAWAKEFSLDTIISTDGDGDRPLMTDEAGLMIRGDALGVLASQFLHADMIVTPVSSNPGIDARFGFAIKRTKIGSPFVLEGMATAAEEGFKHILGFEANGGLLVGTSVDAGRTTLAPLPTRDSLLPILCAMSRAHQAGLPLSRIVSDLGLPAYVSGRIENFARSDSDHLVGYLSQSTGNQNDFLKGIGVVDRVDRTDGLQMFLTNGKMIHLRPSGNAPEMRCYASDATPEKAVALLGQGLDRIRQFSQESHGATP